MFKKQETTKDAETIIGSSICVEGNFSGEGNVLVYGAVNGNLSTKQDLEVFENARILANIKAKNATIAGEVKGNIKVKEDLVLKSSAVVNGDIECKTIAIEPGALFNGQCKMTIKEKELVGKHSESDKKIEE